VATADTCFGTVPEVSWRRRPGPRLAVLVAIDAAVAIAVTLFNWAVLAGNRTDWPADSRSPDWVAYALIAVLDATIALRRVAWKPALAIALAAATAYAARQYPPIFDVAVPLVVYIAATRLDDRRSRLVLVVAVGISWLAATVAAGPTDPQAGLVVAGTWLLGHYVRTRRLLVRELEQRAVDLEREREERAARAVAEERLRIARELHDVLAHTMSVVAVQAGTGRLVGRERPDDALQALATIEATARSAMHEMRQMVAVLRTDGESAASISPTPDLGDLAALVAQVAESGVAIEARIEGEPRPLPPGIGLAAYRIIQEALTNVIKHAGPAHASVLIRYTDRDVLLEVRDDGRGPAVAANGGHGLVGMRERATVHGGELLAGPAPNGGFVVTARLPLPADT
jgi:signal transduction histidine kinase